ncbi:MAG: hypothetical protein BAJATHORv1_30507 [Candidatus Thorarchaeota archaeon]|nr:MAG: hypothetical protein BAJATHORv1_30507 [Candidatus Thorarchaeota archaeon]
MTWRLVEKSGDDIFENLAIEEAIVRLCAESDDKINTLRFWRAPRAVVLGRFQCLHEEVNIDYCLRSNIDIARRFTGGGTVYHDMGNLNFAVCMDQSEHYVSRTLQELYWNVIGAITRKLQEIGIPATFDSQRNCIRLHGKKITGTAGWLKQGVSFIHGTLLIDADLKTLKTCLTVPPDQPRYLRDKTRVRCKGSARDRVTIIRDEVGEKPDDDQITRAIVHAIEELSEQRVVEGSLTKEETERAKDLLAIRYSNPEWNRGTRVDDI